MPCKHALLEFKNYILLSLQSHCSCKTIICSSKYTTIKWINKQYFQKQLRKKKPLPHACFWSGYTRLPGTRIIQVSQMETLTEFLNNCGCWKNQSYIYYSYTFQKCFLSTLFNLLPNIAVHPGDKCLLVSHIASAASLFCCITHDPSTI